MMSDRSQLKQFELLTTEDVKALPDPEWLIRDILPQSGMAVLYGQPGTGKSFLALDWAAHVCTGLPWLRHPVKDNSNVVYIYAEGRTGLKPRIEAWEAYHAEELAGNTKLACLRFLPQPINIPGTDGDVPILIDSIKKTALSPRLIIIDTLARNFGDGDENSAKDMNAFVAGVDKLKNEFPDASVLVVHHSGKDSARGPRGNSALFGAADTVMRLSKSGGGLKLTCEKQKDSEEFKSVSLVVKLVRERNSAVIAEGDRLATRGSDGSTTARSEETDGKALEALGNLGNASFTKWWKATGQPKSTFKDARERLLEQRKVVQDEAIYRLAAEGPEAE